MDVVALQEQKVLKGWSSSQAYRRGGVAGRVQQKNRGKPGQNSGRSEKEVGQKLDEDRRSI